MNVDRKSELRARMRATIAQPRPADRPPEESSLGGGTWMAFVPMSGEPDITGLLQDRLTAGGVVCLPRLDEAGKTMTAVAIRDLKSDTEPVPGMRSVRQARAGLPIVDPRDLDVILVPGLAFDRRGNRLGRGAGYYDRFLARLTPRTRIIGVCFDDQILDDVPAEAHDMKMHALLTPGGLIEVPLAT